MILTDYFVFGAVIGVLLLCAASFIARYKEAELAGQRIVPLTPDDRLRVSLAITALDTAEKELGKAAWVNQLPGNPRVSDLLYELRRLQLHAQRTLRES